MLKTIIRKLGKKKKKKPLKLERLQCFVFFVLFFKLKKFTQNPKIELKKLWVGLNCVTK